jgi:hypothetical protein
LVHVRQYFGLAHMKKSKKVGGRGREEVDDRIHREERQAIGGQHRPLACECIGKR